MQERLRLLAFAGSLRKHSYNKSLLREAADVAPKHLEIQFFDLEGIPLFNEDIEAQGLPAKVQEFRDQLEQVDGILIASPEYSNFMSGVLVNALNWAARTIDGKKPLVHKPVAIMGATPGGLGTARAQLQLQAFVSVLRMHLYVDKPRMFVSHADELFDAEGRLNDEKTKDNLVQMLHGFSDWIYRLQ